MRQYKSYQLIIAATLGVTLQLFVAPFLLLIIGKWIDYVFVLGKLFASRNVISLSVLAFCLGLVWLLWSIWIQHMHGQGTPLPLLPTKTLLVCGPYKYTRNPMAFGVFFWLLGWAFLANSPAALCCVFLFMIFIVTYIKMVEEKELEERFGQEYIAYKGQTPFIIPRLILKQWSK